MDDGRINKAFIRRSLSLMVRAVDIFREVRSVTPLMFCIDQLGLLLSLKVRSEPQRIIDNDRNNSGVKSGSDEI